MHAVSGQLASSGSSAILTFLFGSCMIMALLGKGWVNLLEKSTFTMTLKYGYIFPLWIYSERNKPALDK